MKAGLKTLWNVFLLLLGLDLIGIGCQGILAAIRETETARASTRWKTTTGTVVIAMTKQYRNKASTLFDISYTYRVGKENYHNCRISFREGNAPANRENLLPAGAKVKVFYNPADPKKSCLEPGEDVMRSAVFNIGTFCIAAIGCGIVLYQLLAIWVLGWNS